MCTESLMHQRTILAAKFRRAECSGGSHTACLTLACESLMTRLNLCSSSFAPSNLTLAMTAAESQLPPIPPTLEGYVMYYLLKFVTTSPADMLNLIMVYAPWGILVGFLLARARLALARRASSSTPTTTTPPPSASPEPTAEPPSKPEGSEPAPADTPDPKKSGGETAETVDPPLPPPADPPTTSPEDKVTPPKSTSSPPPDTQTAPVATTPKEPKPAPTAADTPYPARVEGVHGCLTRCQGIHRRENRGPVGGQETPGD